MQPTLECMQTTVVVKRLQQISGTEMTQRMKNGEDKYLKQRKLLMAHSSLAIILLHNAKE